MYKINTLDNHPKQEIEIWLDEVGSSVKFYFEYKPNQIGWFFGFQYNDVEYKNIRLTTSYNVLRAYRNWLPFGLRCDTVDGLEPMYLTDFVNDYANVYILTKNELKQVEALYYAKI